MRYLVAFCIVCFAVANGFAADLMIFSGAGLIKPMEEMRHNFEQKHNIRTDVHYGGSGRFLHASRRVSRPTYSFQGLKNTPMMR